MISYREFKERIVNSLVNYLPEEYKSYTPFVGVAQKNNVELEYIALKCDSEREFSSPMIYLRSEYDNYLINDDFSESLERIANRFLIGFENIRAQRSMIHGFDADSIKENLFYTLVGTKDNDEFLEKLEWRPWNDLAVTYRVLMNRQDGNIQSFLVTKDIASNFGISSEELFSVASENTKKLFPYTAMKMGDALRSFLPGVGGVSQRAEKTYIISNAYSAWGAAAMLDKEYMREICDRIGDACYIVPGSVDDLMMISKSEIENYEDLSTMENMLHVTVNNMNPENVLSDHLYYSDRLGNISVVHIMRSREKAGSEIDEEDLELE